MMEFGEPLHAFDTRFLEGKKIIVRRAQDKEKIVALDGKEYELDNSMLVIADACKPVAIAGVMAANTAACCRIPRKFSWKAPISIRPASA